MRCTYMVFKYQWVLGLGISRYQASPSPQTACVSRVTPTRSPSTTQIVSRSDCKSIVSPPVNFLPRLHRGNALSCSGVSSVPRQQAEACTPHEGHDDDAMEALARSLVCLQAHDIIDEQGLLCCMASRMPCARFSAGAVTMPWGASTSY